MRRIGIVNRGEAAVRFLDAVEALGAETGQAPESVALFTVADAEALFVRRADFAVPLGPDRGAYLDAGRVLSALRETGCDAAWLGWGFASEDEAFAAALEAGGVTVLGPRPETMGLLGDKIRAKRAAEAYGVPVAPWAVVTSVEQAESEAARVGFPVLFKASGGGGGRGIRRVDAAAGVADALHRVRAEASRSFRSDGVMVERCVEGARHVEVQIFGDGEGGVLTLGVRDCSLQRRRQKVIEECPAPALPPETTEALQAAAYRLGVGVRYRSAGTVEFLYEPGTGAFWFLEVNTRLQVEHPVTELVYGVDLVRWQIELAAGAPLPESPKPRGWAVEARVCAEDPHNDFAPAPGRVVRFAPPTGAGLRTDTGFVEGDTLSSDFDPLVAKLIAWAPTRAAAFARLTRGLARTRLVIEGGSTNLDFLRALTEHPEVRAGRVDVGLVDRLPVPPLEGMGPAVVAAAIDRFLAGGDRVTAAGVDRHAVEAGRTLRVYRIGPHAFRVVGDDGALLAGWRSDGRTEAWLTLGERTYEVERAPGDTTYLIDGVAHRVAPATAGAVVSPSVALVLEVFARPGERVEAGACVAILESMKMEVRVLATRGGPVRAIRVAVGDQVRPGQVLVVIDTEAQAEAPALPLPWAPVETSPTIAARRLRDALLGWDVEPALLAADRAALDGGAACVALLNTFADVADVVAWRPIRHRDGGEGATDAVSPDKAVETLRQRGPEGLAPARRAILAAALRHHGLDDLSPSPALHDALLRLDRARRRLPRLQSVAVAALEKLTAGPVALLDRAAALDPSVFRAAATAADRARHRLFEAPAAQRLQDRANALAGLMLTNLGSGRVRWVDVVEAPESLLSTFAPRAAAGDALAAEAIARRLEWQQPGWPVTAVSLAAHGAWRVGPAPDAPLVVTCAPAAVAAVLAAAADRQTHRMEVVICAARGAKVVAARHAPQGPLPAGWGELCLMICEADALPRVRRYRPDGSERVDRRDILPTTSRRLGLKQLAAHFDIERIEADDEMVLIKATARANPDDVRLLAFGEVRSLHRLPGLPMHLPDVDRVFHAAVRAIEAARGRIDPRGRMLWNRLTMHLLPVVPLGPRILRTYVGRLAPTAERVGLEKVVVRARYADPQQPEGHGGWQDIAISNLSGHRVEISELAPVNEQPVAPRSRYHSRVVAARRRGLVYPYEIVRLLEAGGRLPPSRFVEHDLDADHALIRVGARPPGNNTAAVVFGLLTTEARDGAPAIERVLVLSDPTLQMGAVAEPECRRIEAALALAEARGVSLEWVSVSSGARIDWETGTENLDWTARVLQRIIRFTQAGGQIDVVVPGICVGAQAYWNAEATMMMHTRGLLVMTAEGAMVLTGKRALDASGCVSATDDLALGGYTAIMGPNGQAQAYAPDLGAAYALLYRYHGLTHVPRGARRPPHRPTLDPSDRDVAESPYPEDLDHGFSTVGALFSAEHNPDRKRPFAVRPVMAAIADADVEPVERWAAMHSAETAVVWEARVGGYACTLIGVDNQPVSRLGRVAVDGPDTLAGGTLYPQASRKVARAINAASGRRPVVVLANLSGFDGSPESLAAWQLEYGAEIGRAVTNFEGAVVFVVLSRYHGGAYVVFSKQLNPGLTVAALEGSYASVIGGAPAAAVVFAGEVRRRLVAEGGGRGAKARITAELAARFDGVHTVERARAVGSVDAILPVSGLRPFVVDRLAADYAAVAPANAPATERITPPIG